MTNGEVTEAGGAYFTTEICADCRDELSRDALEAMADSAHPFDEFYAWLDSVYESEVNETWDRLATRCAEDLGLEFETAWEFITEMVDVRLPEQHYLAQELCVDILVDTGDANLDFGANCIAPAWGGCAPEDAPEEASIFWLAKQQGYGREQVVAALRRRLHYLSKRFIHHFDFSPPPLIGHYATSRGDINVMHILRGIYDIFLINLRIDFCPINVYTITVNKKPTTDTKPKAYPTYRPPKTPRPTNDP